MASWAPDLRRKAGGAVAGSSEKLQGFAEVLPTIQSLQRGGATSLRAIAKGLNVAFQPRVVRTSGRPRRCAASFVGPRSADDQFEDVG